MSLQINTNILGTYNVEYNVTDESGNSITKNRNIFIILDFSSVEFHADSKNLGIS